MDNRELTDAAKALIGWCNSQSITPSDFEKVMMKVHAKIITDRMQINPLAPPSQEEFHQELLRHDEGLMHELVTRIYQLHGRK
jgi:hypothetical protein